MKLEYYHKVWLALIAIWITNYMVRLAISPALVQIKTELNLSYAEAGILASAFFYAYTVMQAPAGFLGDRFGRKIIICLANIGWTLGSLLTAAASSFIQIFAFRLATGISEGALFSNDRPIAAAYTPKEKRGKGIGLSFVGLGVGMFLGIAFGGMIAEAMGWRMIFLLFAIPSALSTLLAFKVLREPRGYKAETKAGPVVGRRVLLKHRSLWMLYLSGIPIVYSLWVLGTWAPIMFLEVGVKSLSTGAVYASLLGLASVPGLWFSGMVSDRLRRQGKGWRAALTLNFSMLAASMFAIGVAIEMGAHEFVLALLVFSAGFSLWGVWAPFYALTADITHPSMHGTAYGILNSINFVGSVVAPWLTGFIRDLTGSFTLSSHVAAILVLAGLFLLLLVKPAFRLTYEEKTYEWPSEKKNLNSSHNLQF